MYIDWCIVYTPDIIIIVRSIFFLNEKKERTFNLKIIFRKKYFGISFAIHFFIKKLP